MSRQFVPLEAIVNDYMLLAKEDDRVDKNISITKCRSLAVSSLREMQWDVAKSFNAIVLDVDENTSSVDFPTDYVNYIRVGFIGKDGEFYPLGVNNNLSFLNQEYLLDSSGAQILDSDGIQITAYSTTTGSPSVATGEFFRYNMFGIGKSGGVYGAGSTGNKNGSVIFDNQNGKIFVKSSQSQIVLEYISDEAMSSNPRVPTMIQDAIKASIYYNYIDGKIQVSANEKERARRKFYTEKKKARSRMNTVSKSEIFAQISRRFQQAAKIPSKVYR
ncbi:MAG: putative structural protein [Prokaryotic dsDNA virus sp.]|nr:MAG: putative structural protein [Prokaryotic dsDNA virus sp.]|tara:strand:+ start:30235 stop:31056 length:822 start_codon:yes stop_codon:yes gene_type:complete